MENLTPKQKVELQEALKELRETIQIAKPKIMLIKEKIKNKEPLIEEQKKVILKFKRSMDLMQELKKTGVFDL
jgi:hypothetical protein